MTKLDIWDIEAKEGKDRDSDKPLHRGQNVRVVRQVTYVYEVAISDVLDQWEEPGVLGDSALTVKEFITDEEENGDDFRSYTTEEENVIISVETI